jgi:hypothetical protein
MSHQQISRNPDLKRLRDEGYEVEIRDKHLLIHHIPYVTPKREVAYGVLVAVLTMAGDDVAKPQDHVAYFRGECPCNSQGTLFNDANLIAGRETKKLADTIETNFMFSKKPPGGGPYTEDHYAKMTRYIETLQREAKVIDPDATAQTYRIVEMQDEESVFHYPDTSSSRAGIEMVARKVADLKIGIVGVGGTGSYVLDFVAKTLVKEIHLFDGDRLLNHNAFRAPGAASKEELHTQPMKVDYFLSIYSKMHKGIKTHPVFMDESNVELLKGLDFVFVCMDRAKDKRAVVRRLDEWNIPFIDVGLGVQEVDGSLRGVLQVTTRTARKRDHLTRRILLNERDDEDENNDYKSNIQIAELNAMNAAFAIIKWKKLFGFYHDMEKEHFSTYNVTVNDTTNEEQDEAANNSQA